MLGGQIFAIINIIFANNGRSGGPRPRMATRLVALMA